MLLWKVLKFCRNSRKKNYTKLFLARISNLIFVVFVYNKNIDFSQHLWNIIASPFCLYSALGSTALANCHLNYKSADDIDSRYQMFFIRKYNMMFDSLFNQYLLTILMKYLISNPYSSKHILLILRQGYLYQDYRK